MFENMVKADKEDILNLERRIHQYRMSHFYWHYTHKTEFLYKYKDDLKKYFEYNHYIIQKYLQNKTFDYIVTDMMNSYIYYFDEKTMEDFYVTE